MDQQLAQKISRNPIYQRLVSERSRFGWVLTVIVLACYLGFLYLVAFEKELLAQPLSAGGVTTVSIPVGLGMILITIILTGVYVHRANTKYDKMNELVKKEVGQ